MTKAKQLPIEETVKEKATYLIALQLLESHCTNVSGIDFDGAWKECLAIALEETKGMRLAKALRIVGIFWNDFQEWTLVRLKRDHLARVAPSQRGLPAGVRPRCPAALDCVDNNSGVAL